MIIDDIIHYRLGTVVVDISEYKKRNIYYPSPCPLCNSGERLVFVSSDSGKWRLTCLRCGATTLPYYHKDVAIDSILWPKDNIVI